MYSHFGANMRRLAIVLVAALLLSFTTTRTITAAAPATTPDFGKLPLSFVPNAGQTDERVLFQVRSLGGTLFFARDEVVLAVSQRAPASASIFDKTEPESTPPLTLRLRFTGANPAPEMSGINPLSGHVNYFYGNDPTQWQSNVPTYGSVVYHQLYPGIDLRYDGQEGLLKGTFEVAPGADPSVIGWQYAGAQSLTIDTATGDLQITLPNGNVLAERAPTAWQDINGARVPVAIAYTLGTDGCIGFTLGDYDSAYALQLDPTLEYSTYLGGSGADGGKSIAVDSQGAAYIVGQTTSTNFPTSQAHQGNNAGEADVFVAKINPSGTALEFATYLGGNDWDRAFAVAVDAAGKVYFVGQTASANFPMANALDTTLGGTHDAFVAVLADAGAVLEYASYLGGSDVDFALALALGPDSQIAIVGDTQSIDFPTTSSAFQKTYGGGLDDAFITVMSSYTDLAYSTYLGAADSEVAMDIVADGFDVLITGETSSANFPLANPYDNTIGQTNCPADTPCNDIYIARFSAAGVLTYSTFLGGSGGLESGQGITVDTAGNIYVTGYTNSTDFPAVNAFQSTLPNVPNALSAAFVAKFNSAGSALVYSTYLAGDQVQEEGLDIGVDAQGSAYITGSTYRGNFPLVNPTQPLRNGTVYDDAFVVKFKPDGSGLLFSTYLGGSESEYTQFAPRLALDTLGNLYVVGETYSNDFPTVAALQPNPGGGGENNVNADAFVTKFNFGTQLFTVNTTVDEDNGCDSTCSLREAITTANAHPGSDLITFNLPGSGPFTIQPLSPLPDITDPVIIDGTSQPGYAGTPIVELNGSLVEGYAVGLLLYAGDSTVRGLVINGWSDVGIALAQGLENGNRVLGNYIGTNLQGDEALPNGTGVIIASHGNFIGDGTAIGRNIISGNATGILISGGNNNQIIGNAIGPDVNGSSLTNSNTLVGINISGDMVDPITANIIGGSANQGNVIAYNQGPGIGVSGVTQGVTITGNAIYGNQHATLPDYGPGIDLLPEGVNPNDVGDADTGPNNLQNFPVLTSADLTAGTVTVSGTLDTVPAATAYRLDFYANDQCDPSGYGEGQTPLTQTNVTVSASGDTPFNLTLPVAVAEGRFITATATAPDGSTSEFSRCVQVINAVPVPVLTQALYVGGALLIDGTIDGVTGSLYSLKFYAADTCISSPEEQFYLGSTEEMAWAIFSWPLVVTGLEGQVITATATDSGNNTSALSACIPVTTVQGVLTSPANGSTAASTQPTFRWSQRYYFTGFELQLGKTNPPQHTILVYRSEYTPLSPLPPGTYYWRVRNQGTSEAGWSDVWSVTIVSPANAVPERNVFTTMTPTLAWNAVTWASEYQLQISLSPTFNSSPYMYFDGVPATTLSYTFPASPAEGSLPLNGRYYWRVRAIAPGRIGAWSSTESFTVDVP